MNRAFSLIEIMIVVAILGILAAIALPQYQSHTIQTKEAAAKDNLRILRSAIELYAANHSGVPPGYSSNGYPGLRAFYSQLYGSGEYFQIPPENPFNEKATVKIIQDNEEFPAEATGDCGWVYKPAIKMIRLDWPGTDSAGVSYFDY